MVFQNKDRFRSYLLLNLLELFKVQRQDPQHSHAFIYPKDCLNPNLDEETLIFFLFGDSIKRFLSIIQFSEHLEAEFKQI